MSRDQRPAAGEFASFYQKYLDLVPDGDIVAILSIQLDDTLAVLRELSERDAMFAYASGKWSIKQVVGHVADTERILAHRAFRFGRADDTPLPGFDENRYATAAESDSRPFTSLIAELIAVRRSTVALFTGLGSAAWERAGTANEQAVTVRALAWITAGHELHHRAILAERYIAALRR